MERKIRRGWKSQVTVISFSLAILSVTCAPRETYYIALPGEGGTYQKQRIVGLLPLSPPPPWLLLWWNWKLLENKSSTSLLFQCFHIFVLCFFTRAPLSTSKVYNRILLSLSPSPSGCTFFGIYSQVGKSKHTYLAPALDYMTINMMELVCSL